MGGQVLGGGVIVLVAVLLWLVYLLPSWHGRHQYNAAERNAVRLNQALRVLAETSETPDEVRLELSARTVAAQQKLARRAQAERELADLENVRAQLAAARADPAARRARARRRARVVLLVAAVAAVGLAGWGAVEVVTTGSQVLLWSAVGMGLVCGLLLRRMSRVGARAVARSAAPAVASPVADVADIALDGDRRPWTPRELPRPLTSSEGSRAAAVLDGAAAREALRRARIEERMRAEEERRRPTSIDVARAARGRAAASPLSGPVGDAEIEAHVRELLRRRAAG